MVEKVIIMGAAGRDFHNFNIYFRDNPRYRVIAFTAAQIPAIEGRLYPPELSGKLYPEGIAIHPEAKLSDLIREHQVDLVALSYSDIPHVEVMHKASLVMAGGADFILIGATTRDPWTLNPALRSRCTEVFFEPLSPTDIQKIVMDAARKINVRLSSELAELISNYTVEGRKAIGLLADAYGLALYRRGNSTVIRQFSAARKRKRPVPLPAVTIERQDLLDVIQTSRLTPNTALKASKVPEVGRVLGLDRKSVV